MFRHRNFLCRRLTWLLPVLISAGTAFGQTTAQKDELLSTLGNLAESAARSYVSPLVSGFGADLNSGWVHRTPDPTKLSLDLEFGLVGMFSFFSESSKSFSSSGSFKFDYRETDLLIPNNYAGEERDSIRSQLMNIPFTVTLSGPTVVGSNTDTIRVKFSGGTASVVYKGVKESISLDPIEFSTHVTAILQELPLLPMAACQFSLGMVYGTSLSFRFLPTSNVNGKLGKTTYGGFGFQHNPMVWFNNSLPLNLSFSLFTQTLKIGSVFKSTATDAGVFASKRVGWGILNITPFAGLSLEKSNMTIAYDFQTTGPRDDSISIPISFVLKGENNARLTLGVSVKIVFIDVSADYSIAKYNSMSIGVGLIY
ncbi:MAG TPA: DUF6588 family protein [Candidatus Kryptonia bacterium]